jgi:hypothetical protein
MEFKDAVLLHSAGDLLDACIKPSSSKSGYNLFFYRSSTKEQCSLFTRRSGLREFKTIDAAVSNAEMIGFDSVLVKM